MALIKCPDCGKEVSDSASACIYCGRPIASQSKTRDDERREEASRLEAVKKKNQPGCVATGCGLLIALMILGAIVGQCSDTVSTPKTAAEIAADSLRRVEMDARIMCKQFVEQRLRAPSTAKFGRVTAWPVKGKPYHWTATGQVDAQNGFGAQIRSTFGCDMKHDANNTWTALNVLVQ